MACALAVSLSGSRSFAAGSLAVKITGLDGESPSATFCQDGGHSTTQRHRPPGHHSSEYLLLNGISRASACAGQLKLAPTTHDLCLCDEDASTHCRSM